MNIYESLVNYWILTKWCFDLEFWASFGMCSCIWPINIIWEVFWVWEDQNLSVWEKGFWNSKFFFWTHECSLKRALSKAQASVPRSLLDTVRLSKLWASCERTRILLLDKIRLSERQVNPKRTSQNANETWSLKRTSLRLSEQHPVKPHLIFRFVYLWANPSFLNCVFRLV